MLVFGTKDGQQSQTEILSAAERADGRRYGGLTLQSPKQPCFLSGYCHRCPGRPDAVNAVIQHYSGYIATLATRTSYDAFGFSVGI